MTMSRMQSGYGQGRGPLPDKGLTIHFPPAKVKEPPRPAMVGLAKLRPISYNGAMVPPFTPAVARARRCSLLVAALAVVQTGCFSFRVSVPPEPETVVGAMAIVRGEPASRNFDEPIRDEPVVAGDTVIHSLIKVLQVSKPLTLQWLWYSPDNQLVRRSQAVEINARGRYLAYFAAWDTLANPIYAEKKGKWTVVVLAGGGFLASKEFTVN